MKEKIRKFSRRLSLPIFLILATIVLSSPVQTIFSKTPSTLGHWELVPPARFHLGEVIQATLVITTTPGVSVDTSHLPDVGQTLKLEDRTEFLEDSASYDYPRIIDEGVLEVVSRDIITYPQGGLVVTRVSYELIYLGEIDPDAASDEKRFSPYIALSMKYWSWHNGKKIGRESRSIIVDSTDFLIVPRVDDTSEPVFRFVTFVPPSSPWPYLRLAGFTSLGLAFCLIIRRALTLIPRQSSSQTPTTDCPPVARELFETWCERPETLAFIEAVKLYRRGVWGQPRASLWLVTTFVLYSGVELNSDQARSVFERILQEVSDA